MLKKTAAAAMAIITLAFATPVMASDPDNVKDLAATISATGTQFLNECPPGAKFQGVYMPGRRVLAVCAGGKDPSEFNAEEQDTLRHEGIHLAQDCMDRSFNSELETTRNLISVMEMMKLASTTLNFAEIERAYREMGADDQMIMLEFEAWSGAALLTNAEVSDLIRRVCRL
ncbi:hypothetical protein SynSYN20_01613 [Synechococcus sp. SYN20]|uniref:hypothetical protein n=1 Tax=Synechococcus sp. SYN20 TaxID=1050714 RepID=UPI001645D0B3|nr:hypothetical protein [Synechococcus sp. SYN20]QNJ25940.1 hypothetical protein SynSYN20_01613 [Synechococcus sp. SYN20]